MDRVGSPNQQVQATLGSAPDLRRWAACHTLDGCPVQDLGIKHLRLACKPHPVQRRGSGLHSAPKLRASSRFSAWAIISLGGALPRRSSSLPETQGRRAASRRPEATLSLLGLAPGGGCLAACIAAGAGGLLHRLFTMTGKWLIAFSR